MKTKNLKKITKKFFIDLFYQSLFIFLIVCIFQKNLSANDLFINTLNQIDSIHKKEFMIKKIDFTDECESGISAIFYYHKNKIRKLEYESFEGCARDSHSKFTEFYDESGNIFFIFYHYQGIWGEFCFGRGNAIFQNGKLVQSNCATITFPDSPDYSRRILSKKFIPNCPSEYLSYTHTENGMHCFHKSTQELEKIFKITEKPFLNQRYRFVNPKVNDKSKVIAVSTIVRDNDNSKAKVLLRLDPQDEVEILEIGRKEKNLQLGLNYWYKIQFYNPIKELKTKGWIFGSHLEKTKLESSQKNKVK
ncbi:MAG: SH3 domain-containing protein [Leptospiraceae bacterium]|nr:SH3 domain-containing protein [Leptospiraceae bacterium]